MGWNADYPILGYLDLFTVGDIPIHEVKVLLYVIHKAYVYMCAHMFTINIIKLSTLHASTCTL